MPPHKPGYDSHFAECPHNKYISSRVGFMNEREGNGVCRWIRTELDFGTTKSSRVRNYILDNWLQDQKETRNEDSLEQVVKVWGYQRKACIQAYKKRCNKSWNLSPKMLTHFSPNKALTSYDYWFPSQFSYKNKFFYALPAVFFYISIQKPKRKLTNKRNTNWNFPD